MDTKALADLIDDCYRLNLDERERIARILREVVPQMEENLRLIVELPAGSQWDSANSQDAKAYAQAALDALKEKD